MRNPKAKFCVVLIKLALAISSGGMSKAQVVSTDKPAEQLAEQRVLPPAIAQSSKEQREAWRVKLVHTARPKTNACYEATYPDTQWHEVACTKPPKHYFGPRRGAVAATVGNQDDFVAQPTSPITTAEGSFDSVTGVTSESTTGATAGQGTNGSNMFTLQLNSNFFNTSVCHGLGSKCQGFAQFVYDSSVNQGFIQYWLISPGASCPSGWSPVVGDCVQNAPSAVDGPSGGVTIADLGDMKITGAGASGGSLTLYVGGFIKSVPGGSVIPDLASNWGAAEFNVFGDGGGGQAVFNSGSTMVVRTQVDTGTNIAPDCVINGWTAETNSLDLVSTPTIVPKAQYPSIVFDQSNVSSTPQSCSTSVGDPHITTFDGLYYDFYAAGDYVMADAGPDFKVQVRQESGAKVFNNPNVTMNTAIAVQMGSSRIAIYDSPTKVVLNGKTITLADNNLMSLPDNVSLFRLGSLYIITRNTGELVRAQLNNGWMDVTVGLGHRARSSAQGIMASPSRSALSMRDGTKLIEPVSTTDLYQRYAKSWLVQPNESLFAEHTVAFAAPARLFTAADLDPAAATTARQACAAAGVTDKDLLESCTLDSVVLKSPVATRAFSHAITPRLTIRPVELKADLH